MVSLIHVLAKVTSTENNSSGNGLSFTFMDSFWINEWHKNSQNKSRCYHR